MANVSEIKKGMVVDWKSHLWLISEFQHVSPGKGSAFTRIKLKNINTGKVVENTFKSSETLVFVDVSKKNMTYLFSDDLSHTFMDMVSYDQVPVDKALVGDDAKYLKEGLQVIVSQNEDKAVAVELPKKIEFVVGYAEPAVKGDTASGNVMKNSTMENGLEVRVPSFIKTGDKILVNSDTCEYSERVN
ncbi:MAG TPA: elongation factor P [Patescibacteria group bacterium]|nr:elongation factor P [Patescibacteria group bacterium]